MAAIRKKTPDFVYSHKNEWMKALEVHKERTILQRCQTILSGKGKLSKGKAEELQKCILEVGQPAWENFLRRCRDKDYEKNRERISISKSTFNRLEGLSKELGIDSNDALIIKLMDLYSKKLVGRKVKRRQKPIVKKIKTSNPNSIGKKIRPDFDDKNFDFVD